jgi:hypothetical protein
MLSDIVCRGLLHIHSAKMGGSSATPARMVQPATDVTPNASPTAHIAIIQRVNVVCLLSNLMSEVYEEPPAMAVPEGTAHAVGTPRAEILLSRVHPRDTACPEHLARRTDTLRERRHNSQTQLVVSSEKR